MINLLKESCFRFHLWYFGTGENGYSNPGGKDLKSWEENKSIFNDRTFKRKSLLKAIDEAFQ